MDYVHLSNSCFLLVRFITQSIVYVGVCIQLCNFGLVLYVSIFVSSLVGSVLIEYNYVPCFIAWDYTNESARYQFCVINVYGLLC